MVQKAKTSFYSAETAIQPVVIMGLAVWMGSRYMIDYFPKSTSKGLYLHGASAGVVSVLYDFKNDGKDKQFFYKVCITSTFSIALSLGVAKALKKRVSLSFEATLKLEGMCLLVLMGKEAYEYESVDAKEIKELLETFSEKKVVIQKFFEKNAELKIGDHSAFVRILQILKSNGIFAEKGHELAKEMFSQVLKHFQLSVDYVSAAGWTYIEEVGELDPTIFHWSISHGVQNDIPKAAEDKNRVHLFSVASQYNCAEAGSPFTPGVGEAMSRSEWDHTQGPFAQRTNPVLFEFVTAFLTNLGFNMMEKVLPSAGKTYQHNDSIAHGYLRPTDETIGQLTQELRENFSAYEAPCYESKLSESVESVYLMLGAAPAIGYSHSLKTDSKDLQYYAHLANFSALFSQTRALLKRHPGKEVVLHITGVGLGVFECDENVFADAFAKVAFTFQENLSPEDKKRVHVQLESHQKFNGTLDALSRVAEILELGPAKPRKVASS